MFSLLPKCVTTIKWKISKDGKPTDKDDRLGRFRAFSLNLAKLLEEDAKTNPIGMTTTQEVVVDQLNRLILKECPNAREVSLEIFCTIVEKIQEGEEHAKASH